VKDYATEELGVTGGEWKTCFLPNEFGSDEWAVNTPYTADWVCDARNEKHARLIAASKDLYNVLREVEENAVWDRGAFRQWYEVDYETMEELKAITARIREANTPTIATEHEAKGK